jgi:integrase
MPWQDIPAFVQGVLHAGAFNVTRSLLEFVILTAARSGEARAMKWDEVDLGADEGQGNAPGTPFRAAVDILAKQRAKHPESDLVFPSPRGAVLSDMVLTFSRPRSPKQ